MSLGAVTPPATYLFGVLWCILGAGIALFAEVLIDNPCKSRTFEAIFTGE